MKVIKELLFSEVEEGMVLASDLRGGRGDLLLAAGVPISHALLKRLANQGVKSLSIQVEDSTSEAQLTEMRQQIEEHFIQLFRKSMDDQMMRRLKQALLNHRLKALR